MTIVSFSKSIDASTTAATAITQTRKVTRGKIKSINIHFPAGCKGFVHVQFWNQNRAILPRDTNQDIVGNDETVPIRFNHPIMEDTELVLTAWNTDGTAHTISATCEIEVEKRW